MDPNPKFSDYTISVLDRMVGSKAGSYRVFFISEPAEPQATALVNVRGNSTLLTWEVLPANSALSREEFEEEARRHVWDRHGLDPNRAAVSRPTLNGRVFVISDPRNPEGATDSIANEDRYFVDDVEVESRET